MKPPEIESHNDAKSRTLTSRQAERDELAAKMAAWEQNNAVTIFPGPEKWLGEMSAAKREATIGDASNLVGAGIGTKEAEQARRKRWAVKNSKKAHEALRQKRL